MKYLFFIVIISLLSACSRDTFPDNKPTKDSEMFLESASTYVIASPMEGILMKNGQPLVNTKIIRRLRWNDNDEGIEQEFLSDNQGRFSLPIHEENLKLNKLTQFVCSTKIEVIVDGQKHDLWYNNKFEPEIYTETNGSISNLVCDINTEKAIVRPSTSRIGTVCRWKEMPEE